MPQDQKRQRGRPKSQFTESSAPLMQSLDRALSLLTTLGRGGATTLTDLSMTAGIPTATTHRILTTLQKHRFADFSEADQTWAIGIEAYRTGAGFLRRTSLLDAAQPVMRRLMEETGETANLSIADGGEVVFIGQVESKSPLRAMFTAGSRCPMNASGSGKAILAAMNAADVDDLLLHSGLPSFTDKTLATPETLRDDLDRTRIRGWSIDHEEHYEGMSCIGAAILDAAGHPIAGISVSGPSSRFQGSQLDELGLATARSAREITAALGG